MEVYLPESPLTVEEEESCSVDSGFFVHVPTSPAFLDLIVALCLCFAAFGENQFIRV